MVSVIINCLNGAQYLREAVDSVFAQTYQDWEIIFWDNQSSDDSAAIAKSYGPKLRYFLGEKLVPLGQARNLALAQARGDFFGFLDADDLWLPEKLEKQLPLFENPRLGLVFSDTFFFRGDKTIKRLYQRKKPPTGRIFSRLLTDHYLPIETVLMRRAALEGLKDWFDPRFNLIEEGDLFLRVAHDWEVGYVDEPLAKWRIHDHNWSTLYRHDFPREKELMLLKYRELYPDFERRYSRELSVVRARVAYLYSLRDWEQGRNSLVRQRLRPHLGVNRKYVVPFVMSFLPYWFYQRLLACRR